MKKTGYVVLLFMASVLYYHSSIEKQPSKQPDEAEVLPANKTEAVEEFDIIEETKKLTPRKEVPALPSYSDKKFLVCIDPGHQEKANLEHEPIGPGAAETKIKVSGGTTGVSTGKPEYVLVMEISNLLKSQLEQEGFEVILTRQSHDVNLSNRERAQLASENEADVFIRMHADGANDPSVRGFHILTPSKNSPYTKAIFEDSVKLSNSIFNEVKFVPEADARGITFREDISGFNWSEVPVTLIELGFMTNPEEDENLSDPSYQMELVKGIVNGLEVYREGALLQ
ncbi:N-acetylmuramoyl-L-alanine amidase family protein [Bacillus salacetis]|uniref:N-acetylmuramoyl-L-alanine amidase family protein n=1 Tax=Bacillus salacetis TaxID=2315464 RepID=UPI003BA0F676